MISIPVPDELLGANTHALGEADVSMFHTPINDIAVAPFHVPEGNVIK